MTRRIEINTMINTTINRNILLFYGALALLATINVCLAKPTAETTEATSLTDTVQLKAKTSTISASDNDIIHSILGDSSAVNTISFKDNDYRKNYAKQMLSYMNLSVYPCDDFYEYACGNWKNVIEPRSAESKRNNILDIVYKLNDIVENLLQRPDIDDVAPEYAREFELAKKFHNKCLEADLYPMTAKEDYVAVVRKIGGFPALDSTWNSDNFHWLNMSAHMSNYGVKNLLNEEILPEYPFPPYFKTPDFGFDIELHHDTIDNISSNAYQENEKRMRQILTIYGVDDSRIDSIINDIFSFLKDILNVIKQINEDDYSCALLTSNMEPDEIEAIKKQWQVYNEIAWMDKNWGNYTEDMEDCCTPCAYLYDKIDSISKKYTEAAANYLSLKFLYHMDARLKDKKFQRDYCLFSIRSSMEYFFDHLYMKLYFNDELRQEVTAMIKEIRQSLRIILQDASWLDEATRKAALLKESTIVETVGRYEDPNITKRLIGELKTLQFVNGSYESNYLNLRKFKKYMKRFNGLHYEDLGNFSKPLDLLVGMQVNSFYYNLDNSIYVMAGTLTPPVYNKAWPNSLKYATLGYLIGHEFTHGFDTVGANYDETGEDNYWWSTKSSKIFKERSNCYVDHYQKYVIPEINRNINGNLTKDENIADSGGIREALMAYRRYTKNVTKKLDSIAAFYKEEQMPGLDLSPEQLLFLGFAQLWCASYKEADYWEELTNEHAIDKYRVLGAVSNSEDFAKAFNCPVGSKMHPSADKCEVW